MEQDRVNLLSEKERRDRDCKNMQTELNRMNQIIHTFKNSQGDFKLNQVPEIKGYF